MEDVLRGGRAARAGRGMEERMDAVKSNLQGKDVVKGPKGDVYSRAREEGAG